MEICLHTRVLESVCVSQYTDFLCTLNIFIEIFRVLELEYGKNWSEKEKSVSEINILSPGNIEETHVNKIETISVDRRTGSASESLFYTKQ